MEEIKKRIKATLPKLTEETLTTVLTKLQDEVGVDEPDDLQYVTADDLQELLKPIEVRKLLVAWDPGKVTSSSQFQ